MGKVFDFPESMHLQWQVFERMLRESCEIAGEHRAVADHCLNAMRPAFLRAAQPRVFDDCASGEELVRVVNDWVHELVGGLLMELLLLHIDLYRIRGPRRAPVLEMHRPRDLATNGPHGADDEPAGHARAAAAGEGSDGPY